MSNITIFNNDLFGNMRAMMIEDEPWFLGKDVAIALGYKDANKAVKDHVDKEDLKACSRKAYADLAPALWTNKNDFSDKILINESGLYDLIFGSDLDSAKAFRRWVTSEVLPTLRRSGCYIGEAATKETIDYQAKFGIRRIRKTFKEATNPRALYEEFYELSKAECRVHHINNKDRIAASKIIINELQYKIDNGDASMRASEKMALQELISDIQYDITKLANKLNGGVKSGQTKQINKLESEKEELQEKIITLEQNLNENDEYYFIDRSPFTVNCMYSHDVKTPAYHRWINNLHLEEFLPKEYPGLDTTKPMAIKLLYGHKEFGRYGKPFDLVNFNKAIIDQIANFYDFNDSLIKKHSEETHKYVNSYEEGYIYVSLRNLTQEEIDFLYDNDDEE